MKKTVLLFIFILSIEFLFSLDNIVILNFKSFDKENEKLALSVTENLNTLVAEINKFRVIERLQIDNIMKELQLSASDDFNNDQIVEIGKLSKSKFVIIGSISNIGSIITINARGVDIEDGEIFFAKNIAIKNLDDLYDELKHLAIYISYYEKGIDQQKLKKIENSWVKKRHFFDLMVGGGASVNYNMATNDGYPAETFVVGNFTLLLGYQYAITSHFGIGVGFQAMMPISVYDGSDKGLSYYYHTKFGGANILLQFMVGSLEKDKIAFLFDIGVGWWGSTSIGVYAKGFSFKIGYFLTGLPEFKLAQYPRPQPLAFCNNISLCVGYKFNWEGKN